MRISERVSRLVSPGFKLGIDDVAEADALVDLGVGGFCLYGGSAAEISDLTKRLQARARRPLLFNADYEDGVHSHCPDGTALPSNMGLGASGREDLARLKGRLTAVESAALGVRWVLGPVVDLAVEPDNPIVNVRAYGADPKEAARLARAYLAGLREGGALGCVKHFPGHGRTRVDSHLALPAIEASRQTLESDLAPYRDLAGEADAVMIGHLSVPALQADPKLPFSIAPEVGPLLRGEMGFKGLILTDAFSMHAISTNFDEREAAVMALKGGNDIVLVPSEPKKIVYHLMERVDKDPELARVVEASLSRFEAAVERVAGLPVPDFSVVGGAEHRRLAQEAAQGCLAWAGSPAAPPKAVRYAEPGSTPDEWLATAFVEELRAGGCRVEPADGAPGPGESLVLGCVLTPRAYSGRIRFDPELELAPAQRLLDAAKGGVAVAFGSPFVLESLKGWAAGLCAFAADEFAQRAAARALLGRAPAAGRLPVTLRP